MATKIRLRRMGARNNPFYRLVVADSRFATTGRYLEVLGWYDPKKAEKNFSVKTDRVDYWLGTGAQMSDTAKSLIKKARAGEGVAPGAAPEGKKVDTQALKEEGPEPVEQPAADEEKPKAEADAPAEKADEPKVEASAEKTEEPTADVSAEASAKAEAPEKQES